MYGIAIKRGLLSRRILQTGSAQNQEVIRYMSEEQLSIDDLDYTTLRNGKVVPAPSWIQKERCENCVFWERNEVGFSIKGICKLLRPTQSKYAQTSNFDYCQEFKEYGKI